MEFQEALLRLVIHKHKPSFFHTDNTKQTHTHKWTLVSNSRKSKPRPFKQDTPIEFLCPISGSLMNDPIIVSSGHSFERLIVQACNTLSFIPILIDGTVPDFSTVIPNLALRSAILNWCNKHSYLDPPKPLDFFSAEKIVRAKMEKALILNSNCGSVAGLNCCPTRLSSSSIESVVATRPSCYSSASSSSEIEIFSINLTNDEEEEIITKLKSSQAFVIEEALISLRKTTRIKEDTRIQFCTPRLLSALKSLITSRYSNIQENSVACVVNLSLQKANKVKIVRSGIVPLLIDVLKGGFDEAKQHACGAIFSLALEDHNKTALGVLGALPPLLHLLRSESEWTRNDSAFALYHLSLVQSNRTKLVKLGAVPVLLGMVKSCHMRSRVLLTLINLASCSDGRAAILDSGGVDCLVSLLREDELESESAQESCVSVLYELSNGGLRFKGLAKAARAVEVLSPMENSGRERMKEKVRKILEMMNGRVEEEVEEEMNWEELLDSISTTETQRQIGDGSDESSVNSSEL